MLNKTISINPSLFTIGKSKTKKNKEKKSKNTSVPIISPNVLKKKLLNRIKEHKERETKNLNNNKTAGSNIENLKSSKNNDEITTFNDEFNDSINYLQTLSKQKQLDSQKSKYDAIKQKRKEELERKTIKNYHSNSTSINGPIINIDLPDELQETIIQPSNFNESYKINNPSKIDDVPYGVLKGGLKPSYREWAKTHRNNIVTNPNSSLVIHDGNINSLNSSRENRLNLLKEKIKEKNKPKSEVQISENILIKPNISNDNKHIESLNSDTNIQTNVNLEPTPIPIILESNPNEKIIAMKHITKKTIKRKYLLGRSQTKQTVGILIKDRGTRKKVLSAQKDLKRKNINDIKMYLKDHNLIKSGSNAPNDIVRKLYESAMLAGEITNSNSETLLHNFGKEEKTL
jgi:hypothetical protein